MTEEGKDPLKRLSDGLIETASRRGFLGRVGAVGAGLIGAATLPGITKTAEAAQHRWNVEVWNSPEYREIEPFLASDLPCGGYDFHSQIATGARERVAPRVDGVAQGYRDGVDIAILSFDLIPGEGQKMPFLTLFPRATFLLMNDKLVTTLIQTPDLKTETFKGVGIGRSAGSVREGAPFNPAVRQVVERARAKMNAYVETQGSSPIVRRADGRMTKTAADLQPPLPHCCCDAVCTEIRLDVSCYLACAGGCGLCCFGLFCCDACQDGCIQLCWVCTASECISWGCC